MARRDPLRTVFAGVLEFCDTDRPLNDRERQRLKALRDQLKIALEDLTYFVEKLPEPQLRQVFTVGALKPLVMAVLRTAAERDKDWGVESRRYEITAMMAEVVLEKCWNYLQDLDIDLMKLAQTDIAHAKAWVTVAGNPRRKFPPQATLYHA